MRHRLVFLAILVSAGLISAAGLIVGADGGSALAATAMPASSPVAVSWEAAQAIPGTPPPTDLDPQSVSCAPGGECAAVSGDLFLTEKGGTWAKTQISPLGNDPWRAGG